MYYDVHSKIHLEVWHSNQGVLSLITHNMSDSPVLWRPPLWPLPNSLKRLFCPACGSLLWPAPSVTAETLQLATKCHIPDPGLPASSSNSYYINFYLLSRLICESVTHCWWKFSNRKYSKLFTIVCQTFLINWQSLKLDLLSIRILIFQVYNNKKNQNVDKSFAITCT